MYKVSKICRHTKPYYKILAQSHSLIGMFSNTRSIPLMSVSVTVTSVTLSVGREKVIG